MDRSTLLELRRQAGYRSAREFADAMEIPQTTYARWESQPEKIPTEKAWDLADRLGSTIDAVVGRTSLQDEAPGARVRRAYEALPEESQRSLEDYLDYLTQRARDEARRAEMQERHRWYVLCRRYLIAFERDSENEAGFAALQTFGSAQERRDAFEAYIRRRAEEARDPQDEGAAERDEKTVAMIMNAYDRIVRHRERTARRHAADEWGQRPRTTEGEPQDDAAGEEAENEGGGEEETTEEE